MTWVIGSSTMFGYGIVISDIRVTCGNTGITMDILQKAHPVGNFIVAGIAGDVGIGITLLRSMQIRLRSMKPAGDECVDPMWFADEWSKEARQIYREVRRNMDVGDSHIITVGLDPDSRVLGGARPCVSVYKSPDFAPETVVAGNRSLSIGSGRYVENYRESLEHMLADVDSVYMQSEIGSIGGFGRVVWQMLQKDVRERPVDSVSLKFQLFLIRLGRIEEWRPPDMPELVSDWPDLLRRIDSRMDSHALLADGALPHHPRVNLATT